MADREGSEGDSMTSQASSAATAQRKQVYQVYFRKDKERKVDIMKFNTNVNFSTFEKSVIYHENNMRVFKTSADDMPKYGAGSEYGRDRKEEIRRLKYGLALNRYDANKQPYILVDGKTSKQWKGIREGGITDHADYFILVQGDEAQTFHAYPVETFHSFQPIKRYKTLDAEEAEEAFLSRDKILNQFAFTMQQKIKENLGEEPEEEQGSSSKKVGRKSGGIASLMTTNEDDYISDKDEDYDGSDDDKDGHKSDDANEKKKKTQKNEKKKHKIKKALVSRREKESRDDSDEGDFDDLEIDYDYDSSDESGEEEMEKLLESELELKGMDELEAGDEEEEDEAEKDNDDDEKGENDDEDDDEVGKRKVSDKKSTSKDKKHRDKDKKGNKSGSANNGDESDFSDDSDYSDSSDSDETAYDNEKSVLLLDSRNKKFGKGSGGSNSSTPRSRSSTPVNLPSAGNGVGQGTEKVSSVIKGAAEKLSGVKRSATPEIKVDAKKPKIASPSVSSANASISRSTPDMDLTELIKRYLRRKPMTSKELLQKLKPHFRNTKNENNVQQVADILKRLNVHKQKVGSKMLISLK